MRAHVIIASYKAVAKLSAFTSRDKRKKANKRGKTTGKGRGNVHAITAQTYAPIHESVFATPCNRVSGATRPALNITSMCLTVPQDGVNGNRRLAAHRYVAEQRGKRGGGGSCAAMRAFA